MRAHFPYLIDLAVRLDVHFYNSNLCSVVHKPFSVPEVYTSNIYSAYRKSSYPLEIVALFVVQPEIKPIPKKYFIVNFYKFRFTTSY